MLESIGVVNIGMFVVGTILVILMPGPNSLYVLATATRSGARAGYRAAAAVVIGDSVLMVLASLGAGSAARLYPLAFTLLQYLGAAYLGYLGVLLFFAAFKESGSGSGGEEEPHQENPFTRALVLSLSNPKAILFFVSFFVQFVDPAKGHPGVTVCGFFKPKGLTAVEYLVKIEKIGPRKKRLIPVDFLNIRSHKLITTFFTVTQKERFEKDGSRRFLFLDG